MPSVSPVSPEDRQRYADILEEIASRLEAVKDLLAAVGMQAWQILS